MRKIRAHSPPADACAPLLVAQLQPALTLAAALSLVVAGFLIASGMSMPV